jgi:hypothetical protein
MRRTVVECDRCGDPVPDSTEERTKGGRLYAATFDCTDRVGTSTTPADLCGGCMGDLVLFMSGGDPAPAPPRRKAHGETSG